MRCMPRILPIVCSCLLYGFIARVAADIPQNHTTLLAVDQRIVYHPLLDLETDCAHLPCSGWWTQPGDKSGPLSPFSFLRSAASSTAQFNIRFSGTSYIAISGQKISGAQAIVTLDPGTQYLLTASATEGSIFELDNLHSDLTYNLKFTYEGPQTISIAALYFDRTVAINPLPPVSVSTSQSVKYTTATDASSRSSRSSKSSDQKTSKPAAPSITHATLAIPNAPSPSETGDYPSPVEQTREPLAGNSSEAPLPSTGTIGPNLRGNASAPDGSNRGALIGGCIAGALGLSLLCFGFWFLRRRLIARRAASSDYIRARAIAAWNANHWTVQPSSPALDTFSDYDQASQTRESQPSRIGRAL